MPAKKGGAALHVVLLAGGSGTRFWPLSRAARPKQLLPLGSRSPLVVDTWRRVRKIARAENVWVVAPKALARPIRKALPELGRNRLILEPSPRDTGPAVTLACARVAQVAPGATVAVFPTDHVIRDTTAFRASVRLAVKAAGEGRLVCLGIKPDRPATSYGYLQCATPARKGRVSEVKRFVEKPDAARARRFLRSGRYLWNAGMFVWNVERYLEEVRRTEPGIAEPVDRMVRSRSTKAWERATRLSVDYAVMERARGVSVVPLDAGWDDVGSWEAAVRLREERGEASKGVLVDSPGAAVFGDRRLVALVDLPDVVVVDTEDALLVLPRDSSEKVKAVVEELRARRRRDLL